jgi:hypothetical protein
MKRASRSASRGCSAARSTRCSQILNGKIISDSHDYCAKVGEFTDLRAKHADMLQGGSL